MVRWATTKTWSNSQANAAFLIAVCLCLPGLSLADAQLDEIVQSCTTAYVEYALHHEANQPRTDTDADADNNDESAPPLEKPTEALTPLTKFCTEGADWFEASAWRGIIQSSPAGPSLEDLQEVDWITQHYKTSTDQVMDRSQLDAIVDSLPPWRNQTPTLWQSFVNWVQQWFKNNEVDPPDWLTNLSVSGTFLKVITYGVMTLIVLAAIFLIWRELSLVRRRTFESDLPSHPLVPEGIEHLTLAQLQTMPAHLQPGLIFGKLVQHIITNTQYDIGFGDSHRQIVNNLKTHAHAADITSLAEAAERASYGRWTPSQAELEELRDKGLRLIPEQGEIAGGKTPEDENQDP